MPADHGEEAGRGFLFGKGNSINSEHFSIDIDIHTFRESASVTIIYSFRQIKNSIGIDFDNLYETYSKTMICRWVTISVGTVL